MFEAYKAKRRADKEAKVLADIRARDADVGVPTPSTLNDRLWTAATRGMWNVVDDCLQKSADVNEGLSVCKNWSSSNYFRPYSKVEDYNYISKEVPLLCIAAMRGETKAVENLLAQGADVDSYYSGWNGTCSALYIAVRFKNAEMVKLLCDNGADLTYDRALRLAEDKNYNDIIKIIRAEEAKRAQNGGKPLPVPPPTDAERVMGTLEKLSDEERAKLLAAVNEKFAPPQPDAAVLEQGIVVQKPLTLKKQA